MDVVRIAWSDQDALRSAHDLTRTRVRGNLVPATEGRRATDRFVTSRQPWVPGGLRRAIVRSGANRSLQFLHTLDRGPLAWLAQENPAERPRPELRLYEVSDGRRRWPFRRSLLDSTVDRKVVTVDPMRYRLTDVTVGTTEYDGEDGDTIRFGDGVLGAIPADGAVFEAVYRCGGGARGNVAAGSISRVDAAHPISAQIALVTNPLPGAGGRDQESSEKVRETAPQYFRATQHRAVRREDYEEAATTLPGVVQRAGTSFRYTGSWLTVFTAVDPVGSETLSPGLAADVTDRLNRRRLAGYESFVLPPRYASLDLSVTVCARSEAFRGDVKRAVLIALDATSHLDGTRGFFHPDRFTFGMGLERSTVEAAVQAVSGVDGVVDVRYRRRGHTPGFVAMPDLILVRQDEIVRVDNNPSRPERGSLRVEVVGGK
jgi:predicted phage baseplate assembly protein